MFDLLRFVSELVLGSSLSLSRDSFDYLSSHLHTIITQLIHQAFSIALRSKRTRLLGDDLQLILKCRSISPLFGYCCSSTTDSLQSIRQGGRTLFIQTDIPIILEKFPKKSIVSSGDIILHVEWLVRDYSPIKFLIFNKSLLNIEQEMYLSCLQSKNFTDEIFKILHHDQIALNTILSHLTEWCRNNIRECLVHSCQLQKRQQLAYYLSIIDCLLQNSSTTIERYLHIWSPMLMTCLFYEYEVDELLDFDEKTGDVWSLRLLAARSCVKILQRSDILIYDIFYTRIMSRLIYSLTNSNNPPSIIHGILSLFEQLGSRACRVFLLPHLADIDSSKMFSSKSIVAVLERIAEIIAEK